MLTHLISNIHWLAVAVLTVLSFALGFAWHQPFLFGKTWTEENKPTRSDVKPNIPLIFGGTALMHFLALVGLSAIVSGQGASEGLLGGLFISVVWILPTMCGAYLFAGRSLKLLAIDAGMYVVLFSIAGLVMGIW